MGNAKLVLMQPEIATQQEELQQTIAIMELVHQMYVIMAIPLEVIAPPMALTPTCNSVDDKIEQEEMII